MHYLAKTWADWDSASLIALIGAATAFVGAAAVAVTKICATIVGGVIAIIRERRLAVVETKCDANTEILKGMQQQITTVAATALPAEAASVLLNTPPPPPTPPAPTSFSATIAVAEVNK